MSPARHAPTIPRCGRAKRAARHGLLVGWALCVMAGCDDEQPVPSARRGLGERPSTRRDPRESPAKPKDRKEAPQRTEPPGRPAPFEIRRTARVTKDASVGSRQERDFEGRLRRMLDKTVGCLEGHLSSDPPERLRITARVVVTASGVVGRTSVDAPHLDAEGRRCIERALGRQRFAAPVADAPRPVRATIELQRGDTGAPT